MFSENVVLLIGRAVAEPELKDVGSSKVCHIRMVANSRFKKKDGTYEEESMFIDVDTWGQQAEYAAQYVHKGSMLRVTGELRQDQWEKDGEKRSKHKIKASHIQVPKPRESEGSGAQESEQENEPAPQPVKTQSKGQVPQKSKLPF